MIRNLLEHLPADLTEEVFETLHRSASVHIERIVSLGHRYPPGGGWAVQDHDEAIVLLQGAARVRFETLADAIDLKPGDYLDIPAETPHQVEWTTPQEATIWLAIHERGMSPPK